MKHVSLDYCPTGGRLHTCSSDLVARKIDARDEVLRGEGDDGAQEAAKDLLNLQPAISGGGERG